MHSTAGGSSPAPHELLTLPLTGSVLLVVLLAEASSANHSRFITTAPSVVVPALSGEKCLVWNEGTGWEFVVFSDV